ncbi:uncharacterized protein LOC143285917 [Babylonia areolata]|uniref:uncharacterized protein LOC143285917 n=1 Tax=Babylonia areolata TaxID=304850 RepID=UPI003FD5DEED
MFRAAYSAPFSSADVNTVTKTSSPQTSPSIPVLCEEGRPYLTDPVTARRLYACHLPPDGAPSHLHAHGAALSGGLKAALAAAHPAPGSVPPGPPGMEAAGPAAFYNPLLRGLAVRPERLAQCLTPSGHPIAFDPALAAHPYGLLYAGLDVNGLGMRKAATRETTGPLKAWLHEHRKNPYPTKAEKIMLAIITKMTLTQVSTWFANARRRLKKESRLYSGGPDTDHHDDHDDHDDQDDDLPPREDEERQGVDLHGCHSHSRDSDEDINVDVSDVSDTEDIVITTTTTTSPTTLHPSLTSPTTTATPKYHPHHHPHLHTSSSGLSPFPLTPSFPHHHHHHHHPSAFLPRPVADLGGLCRVGVGVDVPPAPSPLQQQQQACPTA